MGIIEKIKEKLEMLEKVEKIADIIDTIHDLKKLSDEPTYQNALKNAENTCKSTLYFPICKKATQRLKEEFEGNIGERVKLYNDKSNCEGMTATECIYDNAKKKQDKEDEKKKINAPKGIKFVNSNHNSAQTNQEKLANLSLDELRQKHLEQMKNFYMQEEIRKM